MSNAAQGILIVANPVSGRGRGLMASEKLADHLRREGHTVYLELTRKPGDARSIASGLDHEIGHLVIVGGDGTVNEVVSGLTRFDVPLVVVPIGTANLLARELGLKSKPRFVADLIRHGKVCRFDVGVVGERRFIAVAGVGFDAAVVHKLDRTRKGPISFGSYVIPALQTFVRHKPSPLFVVVDGQTMTENAAWVLVCNVRNYAAFFRFAPDADPTDGQFDLHVLHSHRRTSLALAFARALLGRRGGPPDVSHLTGRHIKIGSHVASVPVELDGDPAGETPLEITMRRAAIPLLVP